MNAPSRPIRLFALLVILALGVGIYDYARARTVSHRNACWNNLKQINVPLNHCVPLERKLSLGDPVPPGEVAALLRGGRIPECPSGAAYEIEYVVGSHPICPIHGDLLANEPDNHSQELNPTAKPSK